MHEPTSGDRHRYECRECFAHFRSGSHLPACPECGGSVRNIAVPRE